MFEWIKERAEAYKLSRNEHLRQNFTLAKQTFLADVDVFLKANGKNLEILTTDERVFLAEIGAVMYIDGKNGICESYFRHGFEEEVSRLSGYKPPQNPIRFIRRSRMMELGIFDIEKPNVYPEHAIKLSNEFKEFDDPFNEYTPPKAEA